MRNAGVGESSQSKPHNDGRLPTEIVLHIVSLLDKQTLIALLGINKLISRESERHLYRTIDITALSSSQVLDALGRDSQREQYVHSLTVASDKLTVNTNSDSDSDHNILPTHVNINFSAFINLRSLTIIPTSTSDSSTTLSTLSKCHFPHLAHFRSIWSLNDATFQSFLSSHPRVTSLGLNKSWSTFTLPTSFPSQILPELQTIDGHWSNVTRLVTGRPITSIALSSARRDACVPKHRLLQILPLLAESRRSIDRLCVPLDAISHSVIASVAQHLPDLRALIILNVSPPTDAAVRDDVQDADIMAARELGAALTAFTAIEEVVFNRIGRDVDGTRRQAAIVDILSNAKPSLRRIVLGELELKQEWAWNPLEGHWMSSAV